MECGQNIRAGIQDLNQHKGNSEMSENKNRTLTQRWEELQPTKTVLLWSCVGSVAATIAIGFTLGGWVTGGTAQQEALAASDEARYELAAVICVENFLASPNARTQLVDLKEIDSSFRQRQFIEEGNWAVMPDREAGARQAAAQCAAMLSELDEPFETASEELVEH